MSRLTASQRRNLSPGQFAGPGRSYPVPDRSHAANAKARAKQALDAGRLTPAQYQRVIAKANKVLGKRRTLSDILR